MPCRCIYIYVVIGERLEGEERERQKKDRHTERYKERRAREDQSAAVVLDTTAQNERDSHTFAYLRVTGISNGMTVRRERYREVCSSRAQAHVV